MSRAVTRALRDRDDLAQLGARAFTALAAEIATPAVSQRDSPFLKQSSPVPRPKNYDRIFAGLPETKVMTIFPKKPFPHPSPFSQTRSYRALIRSQTSPPSFFR